MQKYLELAAKIAGECTDNKNYYLACVAIRQDGTLVRGINHYQSGQQIPDHHAEARALRKAGFGATLYVARVLKLDKKTWANSRPCATCRNLIRNRNVARVYYTIGPNEYGTWDLKNRRIF